MEKKYLTIEQEMMLKPITEDLSIICYAPNLYHDKLQPSFCKNIPSSVKNILIRFYGVKKGESLIGYVKYSLSITENLGIIDTIWIEPKLQRSGLGSLLLNVSLADIMQDFSCIETMQVCSTSDAIPFYTANEFYPFLGDNNLERKRIKRKMENFSEIEATKNVCIKNGVRRYFSKKEINPCSYFFFTL